MSLKKRHVAVLLTSAFMLTSCETAQPPKVFNKAAPFSSMRAQRKLPPTLEAIFQMLREERYSEASQLINITLQNQPQNTHLHILNALTYEKLAEKGDASGTDLAAVGYQNAINLEPRNIFAIVQLAKLKFREKKYLEAQEMFANALLIKPNDPELLHELATTSYYAYDIKTAFCSIEKARKLRPDDPLIQRSSAMIYAALGKQEDAEKYFTIFKKKVGEDPEVDHVAARLMDWKVFYNTPKIIPAQAQTTEKTLGAIESANYTEPTLDQTPEAAGMSAEGPQVIMDCYLLQIIENTQTSKGQNIFDNLAVTLTPGGFTSFSGLLKGTAVPTSPASTGGTVEQGTGFKSNEAVIPGQGLVPGAFSSGTLGPTLASAGSISGHVFSMGLTWAGLTYNLNIANAVQQRSELISRPSLMTFLKKQSVFFSGQELVVGLTGQYGGTLVKYPIGITLIVTPESLVGDLLTLNITIEGSVILTADPNLQQTVNVEKSRVNTVAKVRLGETLMLSGIYRRQEVYSKEGFPGLQDIPLVQYFFSNEQTSSQHSSIVYMITPRSPDLVKSAINRAMSRDAHQAHLMELISRNPDWYNSSPNLVPVFNQFAKQPSVYYEFRTGDLLSSSWGWEPSMNQKLDELESFLYY